MTFTDAKNKITTFLADNFNRLIRASKHRDVANSIVDATSKEVDEAQIPVMDGDKFVGYATLQFNSATGELQLGEIRLGSGATRVNQIYDIGNFLGDKQKALITYYRALKIRRVIGIVANPITIGTALVVGQSLTLEGGASHEITDGDTFLLKSQVDPTENKAYSVYGTSEDSEYAVAEWYDDTVQQMIYVDQGVRSVQVLNPAVDGVATAQADKGKLAFHLSVINNF